MFETTDEPASQMLSDQLHAAALRQVEQWRADVRPGLDLRWLRLSGFANTSVEVTAEELAVLQDRMDELLAPYVHRADPPAAARAVRILRSYLPS